jgi:hypothetical protein
MAKTTPDPSAFYSAAGVVDYWRDAVELQKDQIRAEAALDNGPGIIITEKLTLGVLEASEAAEKMARAVMKGLISSIPRQPWPTDQYQPADDSSP